MVVLQLHFLNLSNGNFVSQKEQIKLVDVATAAGVGVDSVASSSVDPLSFLGCSWEEWFIVSFIGLLTFLYFIFILQKAKISKTDNLKKKKDTIDIATYTRTYNLLV